MASKQYQTVLNQNQLVSKPADVSTIQAPCLYSLRQEHSCFRFCWYLLIASMGPRNAVLSRQQGAVHFTCLPGAHTARDCRTNNHASWGFDYHSKEPEPLLELLNNKAEWWIRIITVSIRRALYLQGLELHCRTPSCRAWSKAINAARELLCPWALQRSLKQVSFFDCSMLQVSLAAGRNFRKLEIWTWPPKHSMPVYG